jgi:Beta-lactamase
MISEAKFASIVESIRSARDKEGSSLRIDSLIISNKRRQFEFNFREEPVARDLRSVSKPVLYLTLGAALDRGMKIDGERLGLSTSLWPILEPRVNIDNEENIEKLKMLKLEHLLNSTLGHSEGIMFKKDIGDRDERTLLSYIFNCPLEFDPGSHFAYSNAGAFLISVLLQWGLDATAAECAHEYIFSPLSIEKQSWRNFDIYTAGCTGLKMYSREFHKVARIIADAGKFQRKRIVSENWIREMLSVRVPTPGMFDAKRALPKQYYGRYMWKTPIGHAYCDGTDGQYLIVLADGETVITTIGTQPDMKPITECFRIIL